MPDQSYVSVKDAIAAGAIQSLCRYWRSIGGRELDWARVHEFAQREFRNLTPDSVDAMVQYARKASTAAWRQMGIPEDECLRDCDIPKADNI